MNNSNKTARQITLEMLVKMSSNNAYSNILLDDTLEKSGLSAQDRKFASALFYGVVERQLTLDIIIDKYSNKPSDKLSCEVRQILRMGFYQLLYMDSVPESAAVNESVLLAKKNKNPAVSGFVNAILRSFLRDDCKIPYTSSKIYNLSLEYSCPQWLITKWIKEYGEDKARVMLETSLGRAPLTVRVNTTKITADELLEKFREEDIIAEKVNMVDDCLEIKSGSGCQNSECYKNGLFHVQDISSQLCCKVLDAKEGETVLDICSAPGGKTFTIAELMNNKGKILAFDLHEKRAQLIWKGAKRLGLDIIKAGVNNGKEFNEKMPVADKILCDVPCSGFGVIRRKPEIKFKDETEFDRLPLVQYDILNTSSKYLKVGGELVYSTCTLSRMENDEVIEKFLENNPDFEKCIIPEISGVVFNDYKATLTPDIINSDGFFISKIRRIR